MHFESGVVVLGALCALAHPRESSAPVCFCFSRAPTVSRHSFHVQWEGLERKKEEVERTHLRATLDGGLENVLRSEWIHSQKVVDAFRGVLQWLGGETPIAYCLPSLACLLFSEDMCQALRYTGWD